MKEPFKIGDEVICNDPGYFLPAGTRGTIIAALHKDLWKVQIVHPFKVEVLSFCEWEMEHVKGESK